MIKEVLKNECFFLLIYIHNICKYVLDSWEPVFPKPKIVQPFYFLLNKLKRH